MRTSSDGKPCCWARQPSFVANMFCVGGALSFHIQLKLQKNVVFARVPVSGLPPRARQTQL